MTFPRYPAYKDSGVAWLGEVPEHWTVVPLKFVAKVQTGVAKGKDNSGRATIQVPYMRVANVQDGFLDLNSVAEIEIPIDDLPRYRLQKGDVLMNEGGDFDKLGRGHIWDASISPCIHQNHVFAVRPHGVGPTWLNTITGSQYAQFYFMTRSKQSTNLASISSTNLMELPVVMPPVVEQTQIAAFLDRETAKIDALVTEQRRLMELLKEKRQAVISHAVTRGLNPDAPMKPSGIEWLGDVPEHWGIGSLGYLASIQTGSTPDRAMPEYWEGDIPWLKTGEINYERIVDSEERITESGLANSAARVAEVGTLMMAMYGQGVTRGRVAILGIRASYNQACAAISFGPKLFNEYARYFFMMAYRFIRDTGNETSQMNLGSGTIAKIKILMPPLDEQRQIVSMLQNELSVFDTLTTEAQRAIDLLQERRTALISAAVTGQIDVRQP